MSLLSSLSVTCSWSSQSHISTKSLSKGPDGGDGGNGGHVIFRSDGSYSSLEHLKALEKAPNGVPGGEVFSDGKNAKHKIIPVPEGTIFRNMEGQIVAELAEEGSMFIAAKGGAGGLGNAAFKNSVNKTPEIAEVGGEGEMFSYEIGKTG